MAKRKIIQINEQECNGCGLCIPNCPEGALRLIDGKVRLISDWLCDGLGACIGECPRGAITIEEREAEDYQEIKALKNIIQQGQNALLAHLKHLEDHSQSDYLNEALSYLQANSIDNPLTEIKKQSKKDFCGCPSVKIVDLRDTNEIDDKSTSSIKSRLRQWPIQITLVPPQAPYLKESNLLIAADCTSFACANFHHDFLAGKILLIGCPKLDDINSYREKILEIIKSNDIKSILVVIMEVPCCSALKQIVESALISSDKSIPLKTQIISIRGEKISN